AAAGRLLFAMGRDRRLPRVLSRTDGGTPRIALGIAATITMVAAVWAAGRDDGMDHLVSVVDIGALVAFTMLHASVVSWFAVRKLGGAVSWWRHVLVPVVGAAIAIAVIVEASRAAQVVGAAWLVVGLGVLVAQRGRWEAGDLR
ncbi:amino acid permease, partial [Streptomyces sp. T-3]|nr:amino acid permease [Streptomyces sp. T-3]